MSGIASSSTAPGAGTGPWALLTRQSDVLLTLLIVTVVVMMVFPLGPVALDTLLCVNLVMSVLLLLATIYVPNALSLSTFPSLLLFTTLFRLSLNIASTKAILLHAHAGHIIDTFGKLVVGGNVIVGLVVFTIITIVQFVVIAKGSERVAEVGARFTLDAMPGKQMAIDAELRNGHITAAVAMQRRRLLEQESQLHGGMDGAMKFVKGDAIAGLVISLVNIVAGIAIGTVMKDMGLTEAVARYTILTVGEGLVAQIPSLFVSIAAGILITRVSTDDTENSNLGQEIVRQLGANPKVLLLSGGIAALFLLVPGFPKPQFALAAVTLLGLWAMIVRSRRLRLLSDARPVGALAREGNSQAQPLVAAADPGLAVPVRLRLARNGEGRIDALRFESELAAARLALRRELGMPFPGLLLSYDDTLPDNRFVVDIFDVPVTHGTWLPGQWLAPRLAGPEAALDGQGVQADGSGALSFGPFRDVAWQALPPAQGGPSWNASQVLVRCVEQAMRSHASQLLGSSDMQALLKNCESLFPEVVSQALDVAPLQRITELCKRLLEEGVSLRHLRGILEAIALWAPKEKDVVLLTEYVRTELSRFLSHRYTEGSGRLNAIMFDPATENAVRQAIQHTASGSFVSLAPEQAQQMVRGIARLLEGNTAGGTPPVILVSMDIRRYVRKLIEAALPTLPVMSFQEIAPGVTIQPLGRVDIMPREGAS